ncbi:hypothetical protein D0812_24275 [Vibrio owensii]|uniref:NodB homology domain-containing protein n=1 Tax=Vibrio owensii TaxID=696485 RepID=A0AAP9GG78_9VIBR|nr:hypothetical protein [Vibrio owensii]AYO17484.1 hypothetical protein D0812_24275 [Vibrio owensii]QGH49626.1 hypothetical protein APZ19_21265 [Vibrio owensii]
MNIHFTLDYELFFGSNSGTVTNSIIEPTNKLLEILDSRNIKCTFYVDIGYICRAQELCVDGRNVEALISHLKMLNSEGHDLQLHIHPHWEDAVFEADKWVFDLSRYRLSDFSSVEAHNVIYKYYQEFEKIGLPKPIGFRAGGWCIQPFHLLLEPFKALGINVDSTVYAKGYNSSSIKGFDFRNAPHGNSWRFSNDPCNEVVDGDFYELPISSLKVNPLFFWRFTLCRLLGIFTSNSLHKPFGDGVSVHNKKADILRMLLSSTTTVASFDGYKSSLLNDYYSNNIREYGDDSDLVLIGHPKSLSNFSLINIENFLNTHIDSNFLTLSNWYNNVQKN